jgi:pimeloyl-ACP methyl ester carboxylesterase
MALAVPACTTPRDRPAAPADPAASRHVPPKSLTGQQLRWRTCPEPSVAQGGGPAPGREWKCATLKAPLDWDRPRGRTIELALVRARSLKPGKRIGSLLFNFGGPGASGVATLPAYGKEFTRLRQGYDLVGFDPRGTGRSQGITCLKGAALDRYYARDTTPDTPEERALDTAHNERYVKACQENSGPLLPHVDTESAARDIDLMRQVLGDRKTSYFGISYGTLLGAVYLHLFPARAGRFVLDGAVDPTLGQVDNDLLQAEGFQLALDHWMNRCAESKDCPIGRAPEHGSRKLASWLAGLDTRPLPTSGGRKLTADLATLGIAAALYSDQTWVVLTKALDQAMHDGRGDILLALSDLYNERDRQGRYSSAQPAMRAVHCADTSEHLDDEDIAEALPRFRKASPVFGAYLARTMGVCDGWPVRGTSDRPDVRAPGAGPVLVIGTTGDPATPFQSARQLARALGEDVGVEIGMNGEGHSAYVSGNPCLTRLVDGYLLRGIVPPRGTHCS